MHMLEIHWFSSGLFKNKDSELEIALASSPKCLLTRHNQDTGEGSQQPKTSIHAGPQQSAGQAKCT